MNKRTKPIKRGLTVKAELIDKKIFLSHEAEAHHNFKPLKILFESMFEENHIPSTLKKAAIVSIFKGADKVIITLYH